MTPDSNMLVKRTLPYILVVLLMGVVFVPDAYMPRGIAESVLYVTAIWASLWCPNRRFILHAVAISSILTIVGFLLSAPQGETWTSLVNHGIGLLVIWITGLLGFERLRVEAAQEEAVRKREEALQHVRILQGLLSICSGCKKIRDGQGYWTHLESYISSHSEANFSHGLCPQCLQTMYPEFANRIQSIQG